MDGGARGRRAVTCGDGAVWTRREIGASDVGGLSVRVSGEEREIGVGFAA